MQPKIYRYLFVTFLVAFSITCHLHSQFSTYSPYTRFAVGDLAKPGLGQNQAMGGTGLAIHNENRINPINPAAFAALDSTSVYFDFGFNSFHNQYKTTVSSNNWSNMNLHHVAFATSVGNKMGFSMGILPYSSIGYNIKQEFDDFTHGDALDTYYSGDGGIMNFYLGTSLKLWERVSLGVTMNYLMGKLTRERNVQFPMNSQYSTVSSKEDFDLRKPVFTVGLQYHEVFSENFFLTLGGIYDFQANASAELQYTVNNQILPFDAAYINDSTLINPNYVLGEDTTLRKFTIPQKIGLGFAIGIPNKLTVTADYYMQDWTGSSTGEVHYTTKSNSVHLGTEYIPDHQAIRGYHKLIAYRLGGYYTNYYLAVNDYQLTDYGITFGVGLPIKTLKTSLNLAFTAGTRGTTDYNLVKENYGIITFNVTLHDLWFRKRRFD
jgi:hypothetical protein